MDLRKRFLNRIKTLIIDIYSKYSLRKWFLEIKKTLVIDIYSKYSTYKRQNKI